MNITEFNDTATLDWLINMLTRARDNGQKVRMAQGVDDRGISYMKFARGGSMWTVPFYNEDEPAPFVAFAMLTVGPDGEPVVTNED